MSFLVMSCQLSVVLSPTFSEGCLPQGSFHRYARRVNVSKFPRLKELVMSLHGEHESYQCRSVQQHREGTKPINMSGELNEIEDLANRITGSTANLVTASSPDSFKQILPSGTLSTFSNQDGKIRTLKSHSLPSRTLLSISGS